MRDNLTRMDADTQVLIHAWVASLRSTCVRRSVGCVGVDVNGRIMAVGRNGVPRNYPHCGHVVSLANGMESHPYACPGAFAESGSNLDGCYAIHAEQNMLLYCGDPMKLHAVYCTDSPCITCVKMLLNTTAKRIIFSRTYPHGQSEVLWKGDGREWKHLDITDDVIELLNSIKASGTL